MVSILPLVAKKFEKIMYDKLYEYTETFLSQLLCGFRKVISPILTFTKRSKELDSRGFIGAILMNLPKAYYCLRHDLLMVKLEACGLDSGSPNLFWITSVLRNNKLILVPIIVNGQKVDVEFLKGQY